MSADDDLFGSSRKFRSISFKGNPPITHGPLEVIDYLEKVQARDPDTGELKFFKDKTTGQPDPTAPIWQWVVTVKVSGKPDPDIVEEYGEDDGIRYLYVGGRADPSSKSSRSALATALRNAGVKRVEPGGILQEFTYVADGPKAPGASRVSNPPKQYRAVYTPPPAGYVPPDRDASSSLAGDPTDDDEPPF